MPDLIGGSIKWNLDVDKSRLSRGLDSAKKDIQQFGDEAERSGGRASESIASVGGVASSLNTQLKRVAIGITASFAGLLAFGFQQTRAIQSQVAGIQALTGSAKEAGKVIKDMVDFVQGKPFDRLDAIGAAKQLLAMGRTVKDLNKDMDLMGRMAIISGGDLRQMSEIFGKVSSSGRLTGMEFRQLTQAGINVGGALSKKLGVSVSEVRKLMRDGSIDFKTFRDAMSEALPADIVEKAGNTINQRISSMMASFRGLAFEILGVDFSKVEEGGRPLIKTGSLLDKLIDGFEELSKLMRSPEFIKAAQNIGTKIADAFDKLGKSIVFLIDHRDEIIAVGVAFGTFAVLVNVASAVLKFVAAWKALSAAFAAKGIIGGLALLLGPQGIILVALAAIAIAVGLLFLAWNKNFLGIRDVTAKVFKTLKSVAGDAWGFIVSFWENRLEPVFDAFKNIVGESLGKAIDKFKEFKDTIDPILQFFKRNLGTIKDTLQTIALIFAHPLVLVILFPTAFKKTLSIIESTTKEVFEKLPGFAKEATEKIGMFMLERIETITTGWSEGLDTMLNDIFDWGIQTAAAFDQWLTDTIVATDQWITNTVAAVSKWADDVLVSIDEGIDNWVISIATFFEDLPTKIAAWLATVWENIKTWWGSLGENTLEETLKGFQKERDNWILKIGGFLLIVLGLVLAFLAAELIDLGIKLISFIVKGIFSLNKWMKDELVKFLKGAFDLGSKITKSLFNFGKDIIKKIVEGIKAAPGAIGKAIAASLPGGPLKTAVGKALKLPGFAEGGEVPGPIGRPQLAVVHGGEEIIPANKRGKGGVIINQTNTINKETDMDAALRELGWKLSI